MVFAEKLGTLRSKADRIAELSAHIAKNYFDEIDPQTAGRAGELAKADLATARVGELPKLQGVRGVYYDEAAGKMPRTASAISQHYDRAPTGDLHVCVDLEDRIRSTERMLAHESVHPE